MENSHSDDNINIPADNDVPPGWEFLLQVKKNGKVTKYYTNVLRQKFYNKPDLMRNIDDSMKRGLSIYAPEFRPLPPGSLRWSRKLNDEAAALAASSSKKKMQKASRNYKKHVDLDCKSEASSTDDHVVNRNDFECASALLDLSHEREDAIRRARNMIPIAAGRVSWMEQAEPSRASRRLAGLEPELKHDFISNRPLEYLLRDKPPSQQSDIAMK